MALSGLDIFKLLPKTNCGDCGVPTCMAFAMKLVQKRAELGECPHASKEAQEILGAASAPPIRLVRIGSKEPLEIGNETVMFRHEKTFYHQPGVAIELRSSQDDGGLLRTIRDTETYKVERVGEELQADLFLITHDTTNNTDFLRAIELVKEHSTKKVILNCPDHEALLEGIDRLKEDRPAVLLEGPVKDREIDLAKTHSLTLILTATSLSDLAAQAEEASEAGLESLLLNINTENLGRRLQDNTIIRRSALRKNHRPFGYPLFARLGGENGLDSLARATVLLCKYDSVIALPAFDKAMLYTLFTLRQNIYTDPQKPIQVDPRIYAIGDPTPLSPVFVTTNFSLTYFIVSGEIENSGISAHLVVTECEGQSVMTAWAAGKFVGETIAKFFRSINVEEQVRTRKVVIPGYASQIQGDLEESMPGWEVIVGPQEASDIPSFVKNVKLT